MALPCLLAAVSAGTGAASKVKPSDPSAWLKRLQGRYRIDGSIVHQEIIDFSQMEDARPDPEAGEEGEVRGAYLYLPEWTESTQGKADCIGFGEGAALQCLLSITWPEQWRVTGKAQLGGVPDLAPANILAGVTPGTGDIRVLLVDRKGLGHPGTLAMNGEVATARPPCVNLPGTERCEQLIRISPGKRGIMHAEMNMTVRFMRNKLDRKRFLGNVNPPNENPPRTPKREKSTEWVEEILSVSFTLQPESRPEPAAAPQGELP